MEKIDPSTGTYNLRNDRGKKVGKKSGSFLGFFSATQAPDANVSETDFSFYLSAAVDENASQESLLDDVHSIGQKLIEKPFISNIKEYREAVKRFIAYVVKNAYSMETKIEEKTYKKDGFDFKDENQKFQRIWTNIRVVDDKVEKLAIYTLQDQKDKLTILKRVEEIEGILVDLMR
ncbi:MAG: YaaR family protein [Spirochaetaceae bacterium]|nr:YaaR family protein [Spirochaetaceae bacterium]